MRKFPQTILELYSELLDLEYSKEDILAIKSAHELDLQLFASRQTGSGKSHVSHGVGTAGILVAVGAPIHLIRAAFVHNAYGLGDFGDGYLRIETPQRRHEVRQVIGARAEACVQKFRDGSWIKELPNTLESFDQLDTASRDYLLIHVADWLEHHLDAGILYRPSDYMLRKSREMRTQVAELARKLGYPQLVDYLEDAYAFVDTREIPDYLRQKAPGDVIVPRSYSPRWGLAFRKKLAYLLYRIRRPIGKIALRLRAATAVGQLQ
jgi:(p)ppGpp synthase/HD superfamily hydrolase